MSFFAVLAPGLSRILLLRSIDGDQLRDKTHKYGDTDAQNGFRQTVKAIGPGMVAMAEHDDATDISGYFGRALQVQQMAEEHGNEDAELDYPWNRW